MEVAGYKVDRNQTVRLPRLSSDLFYLIGLLVTDGHIQYKRGEVYKVMFFTSYPEERKIIASLIERLFHYKPLIREKKYGWNKLTNFEIQISSKILAEFMMQRFDIPYGNKSKSVRVPKIVFKMSSGYIKNFVRGVIDGDGSVGGEKYRAVTITSGSILFLKDILKLCKTLDIEFGSIKKSSKNVWSVGIFSKDKIKKLYNSIYNSNYYYRRKKLAIQRILNIRNN